VVANRLRQAKQGPERIEENRLDHARSISIEQWHEAMILQRSDFAFQNRVASLWWWLR
jgi:hypothetical protein